MYSYILFMPSRVYGIISNDLNINEATLTILYHIKIEIKKKKERKIKKPVE